MAKDIADKFGVDRKRVAGLLDLFSSAFQVDALCRTNAYGSRNGSDITNINSTLFLVFYADDRNGSIVYSYWTA